MTTKNKKTKITTLVLFIFPLICIQNIQAAKPQLDTPDNLQIPNNSKAFIFPRNSGPVTAVLETATDILPIITSSIQTLLAMLLNPQGMPLLLAMTVNGLYDSVRLGVICMILGACIGLFFPIPLIGWIITAPLGAVIGSIFGFLYGFFFAEKAELPEPIPNPFLEGWTNSDIYKRIKGEE